MNHYSGKILFGGIIVLAFVLFVQASSAAAGGDGPQLEWMKEYPVEEIEILSVCESADGGYYAAGAGPEGRLVMKLDSEGNTLWKKYIQGSDENGSIKMVKESPAGGLMLFADGENLIKATDDAVFEWEFHQPVGKVSSVDAVPDGSGVMAGTYFQGFLTKVASDGTEAWNRTLGDPDGGFIIAGYINPIFVVSDYNGFLMKTDADGEKIWARQYSGNASGMLLSATPVDSGGYAAARFQALAGEDSSTVDVPSVIFTNADGEVTGVADYNKSVSYVYHIENAGDNGYYLTGIKFEELAEDDEYKIIRTDLSGNVIWEKGLDDVALNGFTATSHGGFLVGGISYDGNTSVLAKYGVDDKSKGASISFLPLRHLSLPQYIWFSGKDLNNLFF
ncbi:hypothetical protein [Methanolacinia petrolearia]|uniref:hypothetical protein n=1 Tax=Methanolacinia petrolearia TaxID=54120 RepID=UPI003BA86676